MMTRQVASLRKQIDQAAKQMLQSPEVVRSLKYFRDGIIAEKSKRNLHSFLQHIAWPVLQPATKFDDNWHIRAICEHLEAVSLGQIRFLLINMPFRMLKSTIISQAFPAWEWIDKPSMQYLTGSYASKISTRDAVDSRRIIESELYQRFWSNVFTLTSDQNVKTYFENNKRGHRVVTSTDSSGTGFGGNRVIIDDPISALDANSQTALKQSIEWYKGTASTRLNNPATDAMIVVHQRFDKNDLSGYIMAEELGWEHLILPMRYDPEKTRTTSIGFKDPRTKVGELLCPRRLSEEVVQQMEKRLGVHHTKAQLNQDPQARGGSVFNSSKFGRWKVLPRIVKRVIFGDTAQKTKESNDYSVFQIWGLGADKQSYLIDQIRDKWEPHELQTKLEDFYNKHQEFDELLSAPISKILIEDASSGTGLISSMRKKFPISGVVRTKDKLTRAYDGEPTIHAGLVNIPDKASWISDFCLEFDSFTTDDTHEHDDQIDPTLDMINEFHLKKASLYDV